MAIKTDMSKAHDRVEWNFFEVLLEHMGFDRVWVCWIMACVSFVSFCVLSNGNSHNGNVSDCKYVAELLLYLPSGELHISLFHSIQKHMVTSNQKGELGKEILFLHSCLFFALKP